MLTDEQRLEAVNKLIQADADVRPIRQLSLQYPDMTLDDVYAIQNLWVEALKAKGGRRVGTKIGLTSRAMQMASKV
jgi:2-oxo-hept-3-ene-1,7-dioate hydratase